MNTTATIKSNKHNNYTMPKYYKNQSKKQSKFETLQETQHRWQKNYFAEAKQNNDNSITRSMTKSEKVI